MRTTEGKSYIVWRAMREWWTSSKPMCARLSILSDYLRALILAPLVHPRTV